MQPATSSALVPFGPDIWTADGPIVRGAGFPFPTRMIVVKLADGGIWINSPVEASPQAMDGVAEMGPVKHLVSPTPLHDWRLETWSQHFPDADIWTTKTLGDAPADAWAQDLDQMLFRGSRVLSEVYFLHRKSRTLIFGDFIQNYPPGSNAFINALLKLAGPLGGGVPIDIRLSFAGNKAQGRTSLERLLSWDFDNIIVAHGDCIVQNAKDFVRCAFRWLR